MLPLVLVLAAALLGACGSGGASGDPVSTTGSAPGTSMKPGPPPASGTAGAGKDMAASGTPTDSMMGDEAGMTGGGGTGATGTGGMPAQMPAAGTGGDSMMPGGPDAMHEDLGEGDGMDVITIGDSYMNLSVGTGTEFSLERISGRNYRNYAVPGTQVLNGQIPSQYTMAKAANPNITTVVMTGGGNDIILDLLGNLLACNGAATEAALSPACIAALEEITAGVDKLIAQLAADGVQDVVYIGYGYPTLFQLAGTIEYTRKSQMTKCVTDSPTLGIRCHFVDPSNDIKGMIGPDGIHPTVAGYDVIAKMVWQRMQDDGIRR